MSKVKQNTPEVYVGLVSDTKNLHRCIVEDTNMAYSMFQSRAQLEGLQSYESLIKPTISKVWANFEDFAETTNKQTTLAYHEQLFNDAQPPKKQDLITTQLQVWHKICSLVKNNLVNETAAPKDPISGRKSTIGSRKYYHGANAPTKKETGDIKTYQALKSLELFRDCIGEGEFVEEAALKQYVIDHAEVLKTRQDPWRIFQYYRPQLLKAGLIRHD